MSRQTDGVLDLMPVKKAKRILKKYKKEIAKRPKFDTIEIINSLPKGIY